MATAEEQPRSRVRIWALAGLLLLMALGAALRIHITLRDPNFDTARPEGLLKSDPGLLYYFTERVAEADGLVPGDFDADPRIEHPGVVDIPALYTVGQEFLIGWTYGLLGGDLPLHVYCVWLMGIIASLCVIGVFGLALELTRSSTCALLAAALYTALPATYRTIGFILIREDLSLPLFAAQLWLVARAARVRTTTSFVVAGLAVGAALSTWYAMGFVVALEAGAFFIWFLWSGENPFRTRRAWLVPATVAAVTLAVPVLRTKLAILSLPMQIAAGLLVAAYLGRSAGAMKRRLLAVAGVAGAFLLSFALSQAMGSGLGDFSHVFQVMLAKIRHLGVLPADPNLVSFETRLLWQGPFDTWNLAWAWNGLRLALPAGGLCVGWGLCCAARKAGDRPAILLTLLAALSLGAAWFMVRLAVLPALLLPVLCACHGRDLLRELLGRRSGRVLGGVAATALAALLVAEGGQFAGWARSYSCSWYRPRVQQDEIRDMVAAVGRLVPPDEAVCADFMNATAILAHTGLPMILQPKWETRESRRRVEAFWSAFYRKSTLEVERLLRDKFQCRYLLVDRYVLSAFPPSRYLAGVAAGEGVHPGSAAAVLLATDPKILESIGGYRLLWRSSPTHRLENGKATDFYRLYELSR